MYLLLPVAAFLSLTIPVVVLLYLLKLKRQRIEVSSTILWRRSIEDLMANAPFQRLRQNLLLYLQVLFLFLAVLAATRPVLRWAGLEKRNLVVLIDRSASMQSTDVRPSRLDAAKQHVLQLIDDMGRGDRMAALAFSDRAEVVQSMTDDRMALRRAVGNIQPTDATTRLAEPLAIARALAMAHRNSEVYIISDGAVREEGLQLDDVARVTYVGVGERGDNVAIVDLDLRESFGRTREGELFISVRNYTERERKTTLRLLIDGKLADAKEVTLGPKATKAEVLRNIAATEGTVEVRLDAPDDLAMDNVARGILRLKKQYDVQLVSEGSYFLERLLQVHPDFRVSVVRPEGYSPDQPHDLVIFDNWAPKSQLVSGNYLVLNAAPPLAGVQATTQPLTNPLIVDWHRLHPLTRYVNFEPITIQKALQLSVPSWAQVLAESPDGPMVILFEDRNVRCLCVAFGVFESDWPLHVSFPIFLSNAVRWLVAQSTGESRLTSRAGETVRLSLQGVPPPVAVRLPGGNKVPLELDQAGVGFFALTENAGIYEVIAGEETKERFAVNLLSEAESDTSPTKALSFRGRILESEPQRLRTNMEAWFWLAAAALVVLCLEWYIYCRRSAM